jgi:KilA-N domain
MSKPKKTTIEVQGTAITILSKEHGDYISLTDMARKFEGGGALIEQWLKNKDTVLFLGIWEQLHNPDFNSLEFEGIRNEAGRNSFFLSAKAWIDRTRAKGLTASAGRYGGTYAHKDIAFEFGSWLSPEFKLYLIKEFQRLKDDENRRLSLAWNLNRTLSKLNYRIHTDAIKEHIIPATVTPAQAAIVYANEADLLNVALFGLTAKQWREANPKLDGNMRDHAAIEQLLVLANLEGMNAEFIHMNLPQGERLKRLNEIAIRQMQTLTAQPGVRQLGPPSEEDE